MAINEMPTDELTRRLRADAHRLDEQTRPITVAEIEARRAATTTWAAPRRTTRARVTVAVTLVAALSIAGVVVWNANRSTSNGAPHLQVTTPTPSTPQSASESVHPEPHAGPLLYLEPTHVPAGFTLVSARGGPGFAEGFGGSPEVKAAQSWIRFNAAHTAVTATLDIQWGPGGRPRGTDPLEGWRFGSVPVTVRGRPGLYSTRLSAVAWEEPPGQAVAVICQPCARAELVQIADRLVPRTDGRFTWPAPHNGFAFVDEAPGMNNAEGFNVRQMTYRNAQGDGFVIAIADDPGQPPFAQISIPGPRIVDVRGTQGVTAPQMNAPLGGPGDAVITDPTLMVQWLEYPNVAVTVAGKNLSRTELLAIANGLREIDQQRWAELGAAAPR